MYLVRNTLACASTMVVVLEERCSRSVSPLGPEPERLVQWMCKMYLVRNTLACASTMVVVLEERCSRSVFPLVPEPEGLV
jgi:hypothetical protein